jgi:hypothetical protein
MRDPQNHFGSPLAGLVFLALLLFPRLDLGALELKLGSDFLARSEPAASTPAANPAFIELTGGIRHESRDFSLSWELGFSSEGKYPGRFMEQYGDFAVDIREAGLQWTQGPLSLRLGKLENRDAIESPYSLFVSAANHRTMLAEIAYDDGIFFYVDRWLGLNRNLASGLYSSSLPSGGYSDRDRGAVLKFYGFRLGGLRLGFQDAAVFTGDYFDIDFFANPAPSFFVQYVATAAGQAGTRTGNQNAILGFFADYEAETWSAYGQVLVDDLNANRFLKGDPDYNPDKIALAIGGRIRTSAGILGLHAAGASRYTFSSIGSEYYSYTYYPGSAITSAGNLFGIPLVEEMIGFSKGENSLALLGSWQGKVAGYGLEARLEFSLSGEKSPNNPWHDGETSGATRWLDDPLIEKAITLGINGERHFQRIFLSAGAKLGWVQNELGLTAAADTNGDGNAEPVWRPSDTSGFIGELQLSGRIRYGP